MSQKTQEKLKFLYDNIETALKKTLYLKQRPKITEHTAWDFLKLYGYEIEALPFEKEIETANTIQRITKLETEKPIIKGFITSIEHYIERIKQKIDLQNDEKEKQNLQNDLEREEKQLKQYNKKYTI